MASAAINMVPSCYQSHLAPLLPTVKSSDLNVQGDCWDTRPARIPCMWRTQALLIVMSYFMHLCAVSVPSELHTLPTSGKHTVNPVCEGKQSPTLCVNRQSPGSIVGPSGPSLSGLSSHHMASLDLVFSNPEHFSISRPLRLWLPPSNAYPSVHKPGDISGQC